MDLAHIHEFRHFLMFFFCHFDIYLVVFSLFVAIIRKIKLKKKNEISKNIINIDTCE